MQTATLEKIYEGLKTGRTIDLSSRLREEYKEYLDQPKGDDLQLTKVTMKFIRSSDPQIVVNMYRGRELIENKFYYLDQKDQLKKLLNSWLDLSQ